MPKDIKENPPLIFDIPGRGKITIYANCDEWYLSPEDDIANKERTYLNNEWFYEKLKDNLRGICEFASLFKCECDFRLGKILIALYHMANIDFVGDGNMDMDIYAFEVFAQDATKCDELHWW